MQYTPGDIIQHFEEPFIKYLNVLCKPLHCNQCFKVRFDLLRCSGCRSNFYCDSTCQKVDWKTAHSVECKVLANAQTLQIPSNDETHQIIRLMAYLKLHETSANESFQLYDGSKRCFNDLIYHFDENHGKPDTSQAMRSLADKLNRSKLFTALECSYENVMKLYGIWGTNAFALSNKSDTTIIGCALYVVGSSFDHSCRPNAVRVIDDSSRLQVRCIDAIPAGEPPKITYLAGIRSREQRQSTLMERYNFQCECVLCETEKKGPVVDYKKILTVRASFDQAKVYTDEHLTIARSILEKMEKIFCHYDERITNLYDYTLEKVVKTLDGPFASMVTVSELKKFAKQAKENLLITFGIDHKDYKYFNEQLAPRLLEAYILAGCCEMTDMKFY